MTRSQPFTFLDLADSSDDRAYCHLCKENTGILRKLVPRILNGLEDDEYRICSYCLQIYPKCDLAYYTEYEPKATLLKDPSKSNTTVVTINRRRNRSKENSKELEPNDIPKLAGKSDIELETMITERSGVINYITDSDAEE